MRINGRVPLLPIYLGEAVISPQGNSESPCDARYGWELLLIHFDRHKLNPNLLAIHAEYARVAGSVMTKKQVISLGRVNCRSYASPPDSADPKVS